MVLSATETKGRKSWGSDCALIVAVKWGLITKEDL